MNPQWLESAKQHHSAGRLDKAEALYRKVLLSRPNHPDALHLLGLLHYQAGRFDAAAEMLRRAASANPTSAECRFNLALALLALGRWDDAIAALRDALSLRPSYPQAYNSLGTALQQKGQLTEAVEAYRQAVALRPEVAGFWSNLGIALHGQGNPQEAVEAFRRAIALKPDFAEAHNNLGNALWASRRYTEAAQACREAIRLRPDLADAYNNLGNAAKDLGQLDQAIDCYRKAITLKPSFEQVHSSLIYTLHFHQDYDAQAILREHRIWNQTHAQPLQQHVQPHTNDRSPDRRLKIGYVSPDFRDHCQCFFTDPLLSRHDKRQFEIFCYSGVLLEDAVSKRLRGYADHWCSTVSLSDQKLADAIRADGIDVLVDLTMHMARTRILAFAYRPAPVQVSWLAYPSTTGVDAIDYRLTDPHLDPPGMYDQDYSEKSLRLPDTFWCYDLSVVGLGDGQGPGVGPLPALQNGFVTFGCLNNFCKVTPRTLSLWAQTMAAVPKSRLILLTPEGSTRQRVLDQLAAGGITADRVEFFLPRPRRIYLETYHRIDLGLDTLPYNGHTTSLDSFWMGVPVVTLVGQTIVGRAGWSQLSNLNLRELAARTDQQYVQIVTDLAADLPRLAQLRASLRQRMRQSPLTDGVRFARNMENAYRQMWRTWCQTR